MSSENEGKRWTFPLRKQNLLDCFPWPLLILWDVPYMFHICLHYPDFWSLFHPVLTSGCSSDLNGTGQGYIKSVGSLFYAMMRWLLRSLMSAGGTRSFFTGVGNRVERLPLGLNKSDTKNTCGGNRKNLNHCKMAHLKFVLDSSSSFTDPVWSHSVFYIRSPSVSHLHAPYLQLNL